MVTVIRQHVEGYISFLMYSGEEQCFVSYCKKTKVVNLTMRSGKNTCNLNYDTNSYSTIGDYKDMLDMFMYDGEGYVSGVDGRILIKAMNDIDSHSERRVIFSIVKPYSKVSNFNPKNRRVILAK